MGPGGVDAFTALASTLGKPDYLDRTEEDLWPSSLFHKFLDDAARDVCTRLMERELVTAPDERTFLVHVGPEDTLELAEAGVEANLRLLLLRFHGKRLGADAPVLVHWRWLFETVAFATGDPVEAWAAVCIGLITHTDFYSY